MVNVLPRVCELPAISKKSLARAFLIMAHACRQTVDKTIQRMNTLCMYPMPRKSGSPCRDVHIAVEMMGSSWSTSVG